ncbi:hypothetical protein BV22DRAFT_207900 [Leucogyrophana mollusca]|uniref:Uncharacterized protein n=1 Tax=Leucogyrophana mollusca TaxID=85980 RepID=A0ACB8BSN8_9AGAM|nr:hypothetical protein BV22DRAFT_207900 [Leucogyrophana mollusca]
MFKVRVRLLLWYKKIVKRLTGLRTRIFVKSGLKRLPTTAKFPLLESKKGVTDFIWLIRGLIDYVNDPPFKEYSHWKREGKRRFMEICFDQFEEVYPGPNGSTGHKRKPLLHYVRAPNSIVQIFSRIWDMAMLPGSSSCEQCEKSIGSEDRRLQRPSAFYGESKRISAESRKGAGTSRRQVPTEIFLVLSVTLKLQLGRTRSTYTIFFTLILVTTQRTRTNDAT